MGGKNKKLKKGKNRGKGTRVSYPKVTDSRSASPLCEQGQAVEEPPMSPRGRSQTNSPSSCRAWSVSRSPCTQPLKEVKTFTSMDSVRSPCKLRRQHRRSRGVHGARLRLLLWRCRRSHCAATATLRSSYGAHFTTPRHGAHFEHVQSARRGMET